MLREEAPELVEGAPEAVALTEQHLAESGDPPDVRTAAVETIHVIRQQRSEGRQRVAHTLGHRVHPRMPQTIQTQLPQQTPPPKTSSTHSAPCTITHYRAPQSHTPSADEEQQDHDDPFAGVRIRHGAMQGPKGLDRRAGAGAAAGDSKANAHFIKHQKTNNPLGATKFQGTSVWVGLWG